MGENDLISRKALLKELIDWGRSLDSLSENVLMAAIECVCERIEEVPAVEPAVTGETSDGYHTFNELYHHRAVLFSVIVKAFPDQAWKSRHHSDGSMFDGMFIVGVDTPDGPATYHYDLDPYWDMFRCKEVERAPEWDGHTAADAIERIGKLEPVRHGRWVNKTERIYADLNYRFDCSECSHIFYAAGIETFKFCPNCGAKMDLEEEIL